MDYRSTYRKVLIQAGIPARYRSLMAWLQDRPNIARRVVALRAYVRHRVVALRNRVIGNFMLVATAQVMSRKELRGMSPAQLLDAYRSGRLDYLMSEWDGGVVGFGDRALRQWLDTWGKML